VKSKLLVVVGCFAAIVSLVPSAGSRPVGKKRAQSRFTEVGPIAVNVRRLHGQLEYELDDKAYSKRDLNFQLGELKLQSYPTVRPVLVFLDDSTYLSDIKFVPQMAIDAGFTDIRVFAVWPKAGNMAEIVFGPVKKISANPDARRMGGEDR
jgi:hypothetical protein